MKRILIFILLTILLMSCTTPTSTPSAQTRLALTDPFQPMEVLTGETFNIVIDSNPSTGYHWEIVSELNGVEFISTEYTADEPVAPGSGGVDVWTFKAISAGEVKITFGYFPPDVNVTEPQQTVTFHIVVVK